MSETSIPRVVPTGITLRVALWIAQILLCVAFGGIGLLKLSTPISELSATIPWAAEYPTGFVRLIGAIDLAGGIGILLPALLRIPRLTVVAASGCAVLQIFAIGFHLTRGEVEITPLNVVLLTLAVFILWGRRHRAPIQPRRV